MKRFDLPGSVKFMVRVDAFNVLNQDNYGVPNITMSSTSFGKNTNDWGRRTCNSPASSRSEKENQTREGPARWLVPLLRAFTVNHLCA
jgi:hypothetical protein